MKGDLKSVEYCTMTQQNCKQGTKNTLSFKKLQSSSFNVILTFLLPGTEAAWIKGGCSRQNDFTLAREPQSATHANSVCVCVCGSRCLYVSLPGREWSRKLEREHPSTRLTSTRKPFSPESEKKWCVYVCLCPSPFVHSYCVCGGGGGLREQTFAQIVIL